MDFCLINSSPTGTKRDLLKIVYQIELHKGDFRAFSIIDFKTRDRIYPQSIYVKIKSKCVNI